MKRYGQNYPPNYDLSLLDFPIAIFAGSQDKIANPIDVEWTYQQLKKNVVFYHSY